MSEKSQSRYGILEELNQRKINVKKELSKLEVAADAHIFTQGKAIDQLEALLERKESTYKKVSEYKVKELEAEKKMLVADHNREVTALEEAITKQKEDCEPKFTAWKEKNLKDNKDLSDNLKRYKDIHKNALVAQNEIIKDIDASINDIKSISKEQS